MQEFDFQLVASYCFIYSKSSERGLYTPPTSATQDHPRCLPDPLLSIALLCLSLDNDLESLPQGKKL